MFFACQIKDEDLALRIVQLLQQNSSLKLERSFDTLKQTPLYYCVKEGHAKLINYLIQNGCNVNHSDTYG